jgi:phospholipase C
MNTTNRRTFLKLMGVPALAAAMPTEIARALEIPAHSRTGTIADVEHIVILTQENRSFDHYFGTMRGVRGFSDPRAVSLPSGQPVWQQPYNGGSLLPFRPDVESVGDTYLPDPPHGWNDTHAAWNAGRHDQWVPNKGVTTMTYHTRMDLPYHHALADAFTICDAYHCSVMGPTDPNRYHLWTGWVGNDGAAGGPVITNAELGYDWSTYPERLEQAGISWKVYQDQGVGLDAAGFWGWTSDPFIGNFGDNSLLYFHQYQSALNGSPLANGARTGTNILALNRDPRRLVDIFREDVRHNRLPQVSWIAAPEAFSEHPNWPANFGAWYISQFLDALTSNPDVWSRTALFIHYDEEGGFFDHVVPPTPPMTPAQGASTVSTIDEIFPGDGSHPSAPYGLGMRVPMLVVSPWSKGGFVNSELFDHTSLIQFIEARFMAEHPGVFETNVTPWRRAVTGDLTSAFDFGNANRSTQIAVPDTTAWMPTDLTRHPDQAPTPPAVQTMPAQEPGVRPARALPYELDARGRVDAGSGSFAIDFRNTGAATVVYQVRAAGSPDAPRNYTVEPNTPMSGTWSGAPAYDLAVYGPNGFFRHFAGSVTGAQLEVRATYDAQRNRITLTLANRANQAATLRIGDGYTGRTIEQVLAPGEAAGKQWSLARSGGWYDFVVTVDGDASFEWRGAGHVETGQDSISDPALGGMALP